MNRFFNLIGWVLCWVPLAVQAQEPYFTLDPTLSPDGQTVVFSYDGDLWKVPSAGGEALRLTAMDGDETRPRISPDGQWLAFTGTQFGNSDVFIMPLLGGPIRQLTYYDAADLVESWSWDSQRIHFNSTRFNSGSAYSVAVTGGTPKRLFEHYFDYLHNVIIHPTTGEIFFNDTWESDDFANRKRYKGAFNPDIQSYNPKTQELKKYTSYEGKDFWATLDRNGNLYFVSDEANGEYNLYKWDNGQKTQLTTFATSVFSPQVSANGQKIVFHKDYQLHLYDVATGQTNKIAVKIYQNPTLAKEQDFKVEGNISAFSVSPDGEKLAFVSRGELFVSDSKGKYIKQMPRLPNERITEVLWLKDNKTLVFAQTTQGYTNWFSMIADGKTPAKQLTSDKANNRQITLSADRSKAAYLSGREEVRVMDLSNFTSQTVAKAELWALYNPAPQFSPDGNYVAFTAYKDFEQDIHVVDLRTKQITNLTQTSVTETSPAWSPDGKYLYFVTNRTKPSYPYGLQDSKVYRMALDKIEAPYKSDKFEELFKEEPKKEEPVEDKKGKKNETAKKPEEKKADADQVTVVINADGLMQRLERVSPYFGSQGDPFIIQDKETTYVLYLSDHAEGKARLWKTTYKPFEEIKTEKISDSPVFGYQIEKGKDTWYILFGGTLYTLNVSGGKTEKVEISHTFRRRLGDEFQQMFYEAWANFEENYYDQQFHGQNWQALRDRYAAFLPHIQRRADLRTLFNDMLGELNTSHVGFYSSGKEEEKFYGTRSMAIGVLFDQEQPYTVRQVVANGPADVTGKDIRPGDVLVAVNGERVNPAENRERYFAKPSMDEEISLTFARSGQERTVKLHPVSSFEQRELLYDAWQERNQQYVDEKGNKRIAYVHMKDMGGGELNRFLEEMVSEAQTRDGLILDLRYNTGGNVHDAVLQFLSQRPYLNWKYREGALSPQPHAAPAAKPIVLLTNEQSLSDAEMTAQGFKQLGLGKIVGMETYRWIIFTSGKGLVDGSFYRLPSWGCYTLDGKDMEMTGVQPDVVVPETFKHRILDQQPQLDKALEIILAELKK